MHCDLFATLGTIEGQIKLTLYHKISSFIFPHSFPMPHFEGASRFVVYNPPFINVIYRGICPNIDGSFCSTHGSRSCSGDDEGRKSLSRASLFNATYDSAALENLDPPLPTTQHGRLVEELDDLIMEGQSSSYALIFSGPKSNLAHLCAKRVEEDLCASFFVSRSLQTNDHTHLFPTIAWQLSLQFPAYSNILEKELRRDPSILHKALEAQFNKMIADPFRDLLKKGHNFGHRKVIVIDGLEECDKLQIRLKILRLILSRVGELPFIWVIFCQPDKALDELVVERGSTRTYWGEGFPALKTRTYSGGSIHSFLLSNGRPHFIAKRDSAPSNISEPAVAARPVKSTYDYYNIQDTLERLQWLKSSMIGRADASDVYHIRGLENPPDWIKIGKGRNKDFPLDNKFLNPISHGFAISY